MNKPFLLFMAALLLSQYAFAQLSARQERNLTAFAKLYGYVRYFYPGDQSQQIDWDAFAVYGSKAVIDEPNDQALVFALRQMYLPVALGIKIGATLKPIAFNTQQLTPANSSAYKVISWQHQGYGLSGSYASIRLNRLSRLTLQQEQANEFIPFAPVIDVKGLTGKAFEFTAQIKVRSKADDLQIRLLKDSMVGDKLLFNRLAVQPVMDTLVHTYTFTGKIGNEENLAIGFLMRQELRMSFDSLHFYIKQNGGMKEVPLKTPANYNPLPPDYRLSRYGVLVDDAASDKRLLLGQHDPDKPLFAARTHIGESIQAPLVQGIQCMVPLAVYGTDSYTYPRGNATELAKLKQQIEPVNKWSRKSQAFYLSDVVIAWNVFNHFFDYWDDASKTPKAMLHDALVKAAADKTEADIFYTLKLMCAALNDGHMFYNSPGAPGASDAVSAPLVFAKAEGRIVIKFVLDSALRDKIHAGDVVDSIDGEDAIAHFNTKMQYLSGSPQFKEFDNLTLFANGEEHSTMHLVLDRNGSKIKLGIPRNQPGVAYREGSFSPKPLADGEVKNGIFYYNLSDKSVDSIIDHHLPKLMQAKAIILDMRGYPKSDLVPFIRHLLTVNDTTKWLHVAQIIYPDRKKVGYSSGGWGLTPLEPHITTKIYFLTDASAMSAADSYSGFYKDFKLATVVGQPTAGTNGGLNQVELPGGRGQYFSGMLVTNHDGSKHHLRGILPDILVQPTIEGIAAGRDEILDKALALAEAQK